MISLVEIDESNWLEITRLEITDEQKGYVASPLGVMARAFAFRKQNAWIRAIAADGQIVGVCLVCDLAEEPACYELQQFLIDRRWQGSGYGQEALRLVLAELAKRRKYPRVEVCVKMNDHAAIHLYQKLGFVDSGYIDPHVPDAHNLVYYLPDAPRAEYDGTVIRLAAFDDVSRLSHLIAHFRVELNRFKAVHSPIDLEMARRELGEYFDEGLPIFVAEGDGSDLLGYLVCRVQDGVVWAEYLYITPVSRRKGLASALCARAEELVREHGGDTVYNWVHPNNDNIISLLRKRGYTVLNLVEIRKPWENERLTEKIRVGVHEYDY